ENEHLELNYEGVMLRSPGSLYKPGRATLKEGTFIKLKQFDIDTARIVGFEEAMENTNEARRLATGAIKRSKANAGMVGKGTLGALIIVVTSGPYTGVTTSCTGMTDALKEYIWDNRQKILHKEIKF